MAASRNRPSPELGFRLRQTLKNRLGEWLESSSPGSYSLAGRIIAIGFSGGRDSVALLHALVSLRDETGLIPSAVHVHHGLSPNADRWVASAENFCRAHKVSLLVARVVVAQDSGKGIEAAARQERYRVFAECDADILLLGHHQDDQAETLLFNLARGAGVRGAAAMPPLRLLSRKSGDGRPPLRLGRPWLDVARHEIDQYVAAFSLPYVEDESNLDLSFSRNYLRHEIIPRLIERHPQANASLAAAARRFGEASVLLEALADLDLQAVEEGGGVLIERLARFDESRQRNLLRRWLGLRGATVSSEAGLAEFVRQYLEAGEDAQVAMSFGQLSLRRWQGKLYRVNDHLSALFTPLIWTGQERIGWGDGFLRMSKVLGAGLKSTALAGEIFICTRQGGEKIRLHPAASTREVRLLFQERGIPPWLRPHVPFLWVGGRLAAVGGLGIAADFQAEEGDAAISFDWCA